MQPTYEIITHEIFGTSIRRIDLDGSVWSIPIDPANSDYQAYLESLNDDTETE